MAYDESLIPLVTSVQDSRAFQSGQSNPWAAWPYQQEFVTSMYGTGQYGLQYAPGSPGSPGLPMRQPGTWMPEFPPGVVGTMQSGSPTELSYMMDPSIVPRLSELYGVQVPQLTANPEASMFTGRFAKRGAALRSGRYPTHKPPGKLPPPMCGPNEQLVQVSPGRYRCVPPYQGQCPPGYDVVGSFDGMPVCRARVAAPTTSVMTPPKTLPPPPPPPNSSGLAVAARRANARYPGPPIPPGCVGGPVFQSYPNAPVPRPDCPTGTTFQGFVSRPKSRVQAVCCTPPAKTKPKRRGLGLSARLGAGPSKPRRRRNVIGTMALAGLIVRAVKGAVR